MRLKHPGPFFGRRGVPCRPVLSAVFLLCGFMFLPSFGIASAFDSPMPSVAKVLVSEQEDPVLCPRLLRMVSSLSDDERMVVWIFFTDKGILSDRAYGAAVRQVDASLSEQVKKRRAKTMGAPPVDFRDLPVSEGYVLRILTLGIRHRTTSKWLNGISMEVEVGKLREIARLPFVRKIQTVARSKRVPVPELHKGAEPYCAAISSRAGELDYGQSFNQLEQINVPAVHELGYNGAGVIICMLDTGFDRKHESLQDLDVRDEWDFIFQDGNTAYELEDSPGQSTHGTQTLSVIGGSADGKLYGPAYGASYLLAKTEDSRSETPIEEDYWVAGLEWAEARGADVVSSSVGYSDWYSYEDGDYDGNTAVTTKAADIAASKGVIVCTAMGNRGRWIGSIIAPADADSIIACGAVDANGTIASFSSIGPTNDDRTKPEVVARGVSVYTALPSPYRQDSYTTANGTSYSTPLIAGCAALLIHAHPDWTPMQVRERLMKTASRSTQPGNTYGWGIVNCLKAITRDAQRPPLPGKFLLSQNYPNPFNPITSIQYSVVSEQSPPHVTLKIYNILGQEVRRLVDEVQDGGYYTIVWDGKNEKGDEVSSGVYFYRIDTGEFQETKRMLLLR